MALLNEDSDNEFETERILYAVDDLDKLRSILADTEEPGCVPRPPEMRQSLMKLHRLVFNDGFLVSRDDLCKATMLADDINSEIYEIIQYAEKIETVLNDLQKSIPEFDDEEIDRASDNILHVLRTDVDNS